MKMTMHIDEELLDRVIEAYGYASKTEAVEMALREMDRRTKLRKLAEEGLGLTDEEWKDAVFPGYNPKDLSDYRPLENEVAERRAQHGN